MYLVDEDESEAFNNYCMCTLDNNNRSLATFTLAPPDIGKYYLKLYAVPEEELSESEGGTFNFLASFLISFTKVIHNVRPWPVSSQPFGLTPAYHQLGVAMVVKDPSVWEDDRIVLIGGSKAVFKFVYNEGPIVSAMHMYDHLVRNEMIIQQNAFLTFKLCREMNSLKKLINLDCQHCSFCQKRIQLKREKSKPD